VIFVLPINELSRSFYGQTIRFLEEKELDTTMFSYSKCEALTIAILYKVLYDKFYWIPYEEERFLSGIGVSDESGAVDLTGLDHLISNKLFNAEVEYVKALTRLFDWFIVDAVEDDLCDPTTLKEVLLTNQYDSTIIDSLWLAIQELVDSVLPEKTWKVWDIHRLGRDLYMKEGEDYRIMDWMKRHRGV
jgi:hypothetical protein